MAGVHTVFMGGQIRKAREQLGITQKALGDAIDRTESSVAKYEQGKTEIPLNVLQRIADVLRVDINYILGAEKYSPFVIADLEDRIKRIGYSIGYDEEDAALWINYPDGSTLGVTEDDLNALVDNFDTYLRFLFEDLRKRLGTYSTPASPENQEGDE